MRVAHTGWTCSIATVKWREKKKKKTGSQNILNTLKERTIYNSGSTVIPSREDLQTKTSPRRVSDKLIKLVCVCVCVCVCVLVPAIQGCIREEQVKAVILRAKM